ncbi:hypothetical protein [Aestuariicoccus sp. MJ-SS9]|uniref:hypothetical protein n=1 Tax=Aestuariicoccus sp. MJ-SS9 TaxID=3079855 RepID=UPI00290DA77E|nr:hypothetical protein [Aestuariicoccus sp. MJ-SS9]MDU8913091.1 hypothetical protein [Aestuariicoccus sp. MJ-SS9]
MIDFSHSRAETSENDVLSHFYKTPGKARGRLRRRQIGNRMAAMQSTIVLVLRTIGARRGRAARGRPDRATALFPTL